ncbi:MAG TPA: LacI family DNA-binding transcriptional regulator [Candidatus Limnocylindrales bacterium]
MRDDEVDPRTGATDRIPPVRRKHAPRAADHGAAGASKAQSTENRPRAGRPARLARPATMQDIADAIGVSQSTVSRVLAGAEMPVPISPATRQQVLDMARQMHYRPNPLARGLRGARTMLLGVIVREITDPFFAGAIDAISVEASRHGYNVVLGHAHGRTDEAIALRAVLETRHCDAILLVGDTSDQPLLLEDLHEANITVVGMWQGSAALPGISTVNVDNRLGIRRLIDHLIGLGHRSFGFIGGSFSFAGGRPLGDIRERKLAFLESLSEHGIEARPEYCRDAKNNFAGGVSEFEALMALPSPPTAVLASTDVLAIGALRAAHRLGLSVPEDVSVVGFDDLPLAEHTTPPLTTVRHPISEMAAVAVQAAIGEVSGRSSPIVECLEPTLIVRESSGQAPSVHKGPTFEALTAGEVVPA